MKISIIIFCYNERENVEAVLLDVLAMAQNTFSACEIIVVDDGSTDGTQELFEKYSSIRYIKHTNNRGIGEALRTGYATATMEYVSAIPGDGQFDVKELAIVSPFNFNQFYSFYRPITNYSIYRRSLTCLNKVFNAVFIGLRIRDVNWIKVYRKDQLVFVNPQLTSSIVESEICAKLMKSGIRPVEIASVYHTRKTGQAKGGNWKTLRKAIGEMLALYSVTKSFNA